LQPFCGGLVRGAEKKLESPTPRADKPFESDNEKTMKITESSSLANLGINGASPAARSARPQSGAETDLHSEVSLTSASQATFTGRPERVAELRSLVNSGSYTPQTRKVGEKMIDEALSRPA
jgi:anti-sigma28 factor (negative regulator of flagellin synthesis)